MADLRQQILQQGQLDSAAFLALSKLIQDALITEVMAIQTRIADAHVHWHEPTKIEEHSGGAAA